MYMVERIKLADRVNDAKVNTGSGEAPALEGYIVSGKNCYLSNRTVSRSTAISYHYILKGSHFIPWGIIYS